MLPRLKWALCLAFCLRSLVFIAAIFLVRDFSVFHAKDTASYLQPAKELLTQGSFTTHGVPEIIRTPGYPLFLCPGILSNHVELLTIILQIALSCLTVSLVFGITRQVFADEKIAVSSALFYAIEPLSIIYSCWLLSDTLFITLLAAALYFFIPLLCLEPKLPRKTNDRSSRKLQSATRGMLIYAGAAEAQRSKKKFGLLVLSALFLVAAIYVRPIGYLLPVIFTTVLIFRGIACNRNNRRKSFAFIAQACLFILLTMSLLSLWHMRNNEITGYGGFSAAAEFNLYFHQSAALKASQQNQPFYQVLDEMGFYTSEKYFANHPEQLNWSAAQRYDFMRDEGLRAVISAPVTFAQTYLKGILIVLIDPGVSDYLRLFRLYPVSGKAMNSIVSLGVFTTAANFVTTNPLLVFWALVFGVILFAYYLLALPGLMGQLENKMPVLLLLLTSIYLIALAGGTMGAGRFRAPVMVFISIFAGRGLTIALANRKVMSERFGAILHETALGLRILSRR